MTLAEIVTMWIDCKSLTRAPSTIDGYRRLARLYVDTAGCAGTPVDQLAEGDMIALLQPLLSRGCTRQARLLQVLVRAALQGSLRRGELMRNPMDSIDRVKHKSKLTAWLTVDQARQLISSSQERGDPYMIAWVLMICCGLRRGEVLGLRWQDIDLERCILHISRQRVRVDGAVRTTRPKSDAGVRDIPIADHIAALLRPLATTGDVLPGATDKSIRDALDAAIRAAGVPRVTPHGLRHTMAAAAAGGGVPIKILQQLMGHAHYTTTADIYAHVDQAPRKSAAEEIATLVLGARLEIA